MAFSFWLNRLKQQYQFNKSKDNLNPRLAKNLEKLKSFEEDPILFAGYIKSGNTWLRFLIYNYFNVLLNGATETLTYQQLNRWQHVSLLDPIEPAIPPDGFPFLARTHSPYNKVYKLFSKGVFVYRNPLDTLVSAWHFNRNLPKSNHRHLDDIDRYVLHYITLWELHTKSYLTQDRFIHIRYESLQSKPLEELNKVIKYLGYTFDTKTAKKSIELSDFHSIKKMGRDTNQQSGNAGKGFKGEFARKGKVGGFREELNPSTIQTCRPFLKKFDFDWLWRD